MIGVDSLFGSRGAAIGLLPGAAAVGFSDCKSDTLAIRAAGAVPTDEDRFPGSCRVMREVTERAQMPVPSPGLSSERSGSTDPRTGRPRMA